MVRYRVRRIGLASALRVGFVLGWLVALPPALVLGWVVIKLVELVDGALSGLRQAEVRLPSFELPVVGLVELGSVPVDVATPLGLDSAARSTADLASQLPLVFVGTTLAAVLVGALLFVLGALLFALGYNLIAGMGAGLELDLLPVGREQQEHDHTA
nr:MAG: hypothetical protein DIU80_23095 [Chloroflexota bacterium]